MPLSIQNVLRGYTFKLWHQIIFLKMNFGVQDITCTSKLVKIRDIGLSSLAQFIWSVVQHRSNIDSILNIACCVYYFFPKTFCKFRFIDRGACHLLQRSIFPFYNPIVIRSSRRRKIMENSMCFTKVFKRLIFKIFL